MNNPYRKYAPTNDSDLAWRNAWKAWLKDSVGERARREMDFDDDTYLVDFETQRNERLWHDTLYGAVVAIAVWLVVVALCFWLFGVTVRI